MESKQNITCTNNNREQRMSVKQVAALLNIGKSTVWCWAASGRLPKPERYGSRCSRWKLGDILDAVNGSDNGDAA